MKTPGALVAIGENSPRTSLGPSGLGSYAALVDTLGRQGRAGIRLQARTLLADGGVAATFTGRYVAIGKA